MFRLLIPLAALLASAPASAQTENVEVDPVTCWWRSSAAAVRVGEAFTVVLTCSFLQADAARVIADESRLDPAVVQLPPFEVVGGSRARELTTAGRRFVQYEYRLQLVAESAFASEVTVPSVQVPYHVESRVAGGESLAGRDLTYALPSIAMRVLSLVPDTATDIREAPVASFAAIEDVGFRATLSRLGGGILLAAGGLTIALALLGALRQRRAAAAREARPLADAVIIRAVGRELATVEEQVRAAGWTPALAARALAALRIVAAYAADRPVSQRPDRTSPTVSGPLDGEIAIEHHGRRTSVSAAATTSDDEALRDAMTRLTAAQYGREGRFDARDGDVLRAAREMAARLAARRPVLERLWAR